jgi:tRNA 2-selenouridine synthase
MSLNDRVALLLQDYAFFVENVAFFCDRLATLTELRGRETVARWQAQARAGQMADVVLDLLDKHYDPRYEESMARNFAAYPTSTRWPVAYTGAGSFDDLARRLLATAS